MLTNHLQPLYYCLPKFVFFARHCLKNCYFCHQVLYASISDSVSNGITDSSKNASVLLHRSRSWFRKGHPCRMDYIGGCPAILYTLRCESIRCYFSDDIVRAVYIGINVPVARCTVQATLDPFPAKGVFGVVCVTYRKRVTVKEAGLRGVGLFCDQNGDTD